MHKTKFQRKGRTLTKTIDDLLESPRFKIANDLFKFDKSFMRAILIELGMEAQDVAKNTVIREMMRHQGLDRFELRPMLSRVNDFCTYNIHFTQLDEVSRMYYMKDPLGKLDDSAKKKVLEEIRKELNEEKKD